MPLFLVLGLWAAGGAAATYVTYKSVKDKRRYNVRREKGVSDLGEAARKGKVRMGGAGPASGEHLQPINRARFRIDRG